MSVLESLLSYACNDLLVKSVLFTLIAIAVRWLVVYFMTIARLPPGPWGLPFIGYVPWMGKNAHETFVKLGKKYGGVFSINLGGETMVVLNDWPTIKASLVDQPKHFDGRVKNMFTWQLVTEGINISYHDGPIWVKERKLVIKCLRNIGLGKKSMEGLLIDAAQEISTTFTKHEGNLIEMESLFFKPILKLNWILIASQILDDNQLHDSEKVIDVIFKALLPHHYLNVFPWLRFLLPNASGYNKFMQSCHILKAHLMELIGQHLSSQNENSERDFIDHYLDAIKTHNAEMKPKCPPYDVNHLRQVMLDVFAAGVDTASSTCLWGFLYLALYPQVQKKVQMELDSVVGRQRSPRIDDMPRLSYLMATIMEIHRLGSVGPLSIPHRVTRTSKVYNYTIPKDTTCLQNIYAVHRDPQLWDEPEEFRPERFLKGPRVCIGQDLAEMELKVFFSCLLHRFTFSIPQHLPKPTLEPDVGLTMKPFPYKLIVFERNE